MSRNPRITDKEWGLLKGAIQRVFSRSELRKQALAAARIQHTDPKHPRVTKWSRCDMCKLPTPEYKADVDHIEPRVPLNSSLKEMGMELLVNRTWCELIGLQILCKGCHNLKSASENAIRRKLKKERK